MDLLGTLAPAGDRKAALLDTLGPVVVPNIQPVEEDTAEMVEDMVLTAEKTPLKN